MKIEGIAQIIAGSLLCLLAACGSDVNSDRFYAEPQHGELIEQALREIKETVEREAWENSPHPGLKVDQGTLIRGDSLETIMSGKVSPDRITKYLAAADAVFPIRSLRIGHGYVLVRDAEGEIMRLEYEIDSNQVLIVEGDEPVARVETNPYYTTLAVISMPVEDDMYETVANVGEHPQVARNVMQIFGSEINFSRDLEKGDWCTILVEKNVRPNGIATYGRVLASQFHVKKRIFEAFLFKDNSGSAQYYNGNGENLRKTFLKSPLAIIQVSSKFTHSRRHPIFGDIRPHLGVDYAAPIGTPVKAVADGVVDFIGQDGGFGKKVVLRHGQKMESWYSHLSRYGRGLVKGEHVEQGDVIGYVGSTGVSTGPHLDFRLKRNGEFIDPTKAINHRGISVSADDLKKFKTVMQIERDYLEGRRSLSEYQQDSLVGVNKVVVPRQAASERRTQQKESVETKRKQYSMKKQKRKSKESNAKVERKKDSKKKKKK